MRHLPIDEAILRRENTVKPCCVRLVVQVPAWSNGKCGPFENAGKRVPDL